MSQTHRELVYDPIHSGRRFKWFMRLNRPERVREDAWFWGEHAVMNPRETPARYRRNPYPPGRRHDAYEEGRQSALDEMKRYGESRAQCRAERNW